MSDHRVDMLGVLPRSARLAAALCLGACLLLAVDAGALAQDDMVRVKPQAPLDQMRGQLPGPAAGRQILGFGELTKYGSPSKGIVIEARPGAAVVAPSDGWVIFAGNIKGHGASIVINAGGGHHFVIVGFAEIDIELGQFVLSGEPIGTLPRATDAQAAPPVLYVELRKDGQAIDPGPWWRKN